MLFHGLWRVLYDGEDDFDAQISISLEQLSRGKESLICNFDLENF